MAAESTDLAIESAPGGRRRRRRHRKRSRRTFRKSLGRQLKEVGLLAALILLSLGVAFWITHRDNDPVTPGEVR
jgi:hypothetical protein